MDVRKCLEYKRVIVGTLNDNYAKNSLKLSEPSEPIDMDKACVQHEEFVKKLEACLPGKVLQIPSDSRYPDQVFVDDPAVAAAGRAVLTKVRPESRKGERNAMKKALDELGVSYTEMINPEAVLDGGDVLFTGREFLIGLSTRTNQAGIDEFARIYSEWPVTGITVKEGQGVLHLKSMCSLCGYDTLAIGDTEAGHLAWDEICSKAHYKYKRVLFPDNNGANCLFINGVIFHPSEEDYPESYKVWQSMEGEKISVSYSELIKANGSLTCCVLLFN